MQAYAPEGESCRASERRRQGGGRSGYVRTRLSEAAEDEPQERENRGGRGKKIEPSSKEEDKEVCVGKEADHGMRKIILAVSLVLMMVLSSVAAAYTLEVTTVTNLPIDGVYTDRTSEKQAEFPNCKKALQVSATLFQNKANTIEFGINFDSPEGKRRVAVYLERTGGGHEKIYDEETDYMWLFDTFDVWKSSEYDLSRPELAVTGCIVVCVDNVVPEVTPTPPPVLDPTPTPYTKSSGGGCNAAFSPLALLLAIPLFLMKS